MVDACDPDANIENLRQLIKLNTGVDIKLTKKEICQAYNEIQEGKLPLPPMVMNSTRTYLVDKKSPLNPNDYEKLFDSTTKRADLKRIAGKVGLKNVDQMTKSQITDAIGKRLRYMKIHEPVKFARRRRVSVTKNTAVNNNTAVNGYNTNINSAMNNTNVNRVNTNVNTNVNRVNTNVNRVNTNVNRVNTNVNRVNTNVNRVNTNVGRVNTNVNRVNTNVNRVNTNVGRVNRVNTNVKRVNRPSKVSFPKGGLFGRGEKPKFLGGTKSAVKQPNMNVSKKKKGFFASLFGKKENKNFIAASEFKGSKEGYVFRKGEKGLGYYLNTGRVQGPALPSTNIIQPVPANEDFSLELAVARVRQLGLKREKKFINQIQLGTKKRKQIVIESEKAKEEENQFIAFLDQLDISNTNRNNFKRRMATDDFKQIQVEAQIKADERSNVIRTNEQKMGMFLNTTNLSNVNKQLFINKARKDGSNINTLIEEARKLNNDIKYKKLTEKQDQFRKILQNYNKLSNIDKNALVQEVKVNANVNTMKQMADNLLKKRMEEKKNITSQNLLSFLTPLKINQKNKDEFLRLFRNEGANINSIKSEALKLQEAKTSYNMNELRTRLETRLQEIGLNQLNKNTITKKFSNANIKNDKLVDALLEEAKSLKKQRNTEGLNKVQREYRAFLNTLPGLTSNDKQQLMNNGNMNRNKAKTLSNRRVSNKKQDERNRFSKFLVELGLNNNDRSTMMAEFNGNKLTVNALEKNARALKNKRNIEKKVVNKEILMKTLKDANLRNELKINIERRFNANEANLKSLQNEILKVLKNTQSAKLANNKAKLANNVKGSILSNENKNAFIRRLSTENVNVKALRNELNGMIKNMVEKQRTKDRDELEEYMKTKGVSTENQKTILNKFNVSNKIALANLKQEVNAILVLRLQQKRDANAAVLTNRGKQIGLTNQEIKNLTNKLNREKLESLMNEANAIAKKKAQNKKNEIERAKSNYINKLGLNANNKRNILAQNLNLNSTKSLANQTLQKRIAERRAKNMTKLNLHLNKLNLNNQEKRKFYNNFNRNVNLNTIMKNATNFEAKKKANIKSAQLEDLKKFLNQQGLNDGEQRQFINRLNKNQDDLAALKVEAKKFMDEKLKQLKAKKRGELVNVLKGLSNLTQNDINGILKNFDNTNVNGNVLKKRAQEINKSRKDEKYAQDEEEFYMYLNTLQNLTPQNRTEITAKLNSYFTNWNAIKKLATNTAVGRAKERRAAEKADLNNYMTNMGFNNNSKRIFFKDLDDGKYIKNVKANAAAYKKDLDAKRKATARKGFANLLNTLYLNKSDKNALLEQFNDETTGLNQLQNKARAKEANTIERNRDKLTLYLSDELKLNTPDVNLLVKNYNADPRSLNTLRNRGRQLKNARNEEERKEIRRQVKEYLNGLNLLNNKNKQNIINKNLPYNNAKAEGNKAQEFKRVAKRGVEREKLVNAVKNLSNADQKNLLNKFNTRNVTLNSMLNEAKDLKTKRATEKRARERNELYNALNGLNMNVADRNTIMNKFNKSNATVNALRNEAVKLKNQRVIQKRAQNRNELESILNGMNINKSDKQNILSKFNANKTTTLTSLRANAEKLLERRETERRLAGRIELEKYLTKIGLSRSNTNSILDEFNTNKSITTTNAREKANALLIRRIKEKTAENRENLVEYMNSLNITNSNKAAILKNFDSETTSLNNLKKRASNINTEIKTKVAERRELSNLVNELGINGTELLQKYNNGRSSLRNLKKDAANLKKLMNAKIVKNKKENLREFMVNTRIGNKNKNSFLNRVDINTNMNSIKAEVRELNNSLKARNDEFARKKTELSTYLNTLNNLSSNQRSTLLRKIVNANTNIQLLKNEGAKLNKNAKNKKAEQKRLEEEKRIKEEEAKKALNQKKLENHLRSLKHLTAKEMEGYAKNLLNGKATLENLIAVSKAKNADNEKDKDNLKNYVRRAAIPKNKKNVYLKQLNTPYVNVTPIKGLVNANIQAEKVALQKSIKNAEAKLKKLSNVTTDEKGQFKIRLQKESVGDVLKEAEKLDANRKQSRKNKNKMTKNVAESLRTLSTLTRNNRKKFMGRLPKNGPNKVLANAQALNKERKNAVAKKKAEEEAKKKAEEEAKKKAEEARKARNQQTKQVATKLQGLTSLERENRKKLMNRLPQNGPNKVLANAQALDKERKTAKAKEEAEKRMAEDKRKAEEAKKKAEEAKKKVRNLQTKKLATRLQGLTSLKRENRKKFMNRLEQNGFSRVLGNAQALNRERKQDEESTRRGVEWKLKKIGVKGTNLQALMKRWNDSKNTTIWADARKIVEDEKAKAMAKQPLLDKVVREIPGALGQWRRGWEDAIRKATTPEELQRLDRLLDQKAKLRTEIEKAPIAEDKRRGQLRFVMQLRNDVDKRRQELARDIKSKRDQGDKATKETATKLQSLNKLGRDNRKRFMNRISKGENARAVLRNADKLQRDRTAKQRVEAERKQREQQQARERKERKQKTREYEKGKQAKLRANTAKMLQGMSGLERANRKEFMNRLGRGEEPSSIIRNARLRDERRRTRVQTKPPVPKKTVIVTKPRGKKMKAKNRIRMNVAKRQQKQQQRRRR
jgi:hypothetical protein